MTVEGYEQLIQEANKEIGYCEQMISIIKKINLDLSNCIKDLENAASALDAGLIILYKPYGELIRERITTINSFNDNIDDAIPLIKARIDELRKNIAGWEIAKKSLSARLASLKQKIFGNGNESDKK